jgi:Kef-type K+ transport system membrane component KefB
MLILTYWEVGMEPFELLRAHIHALPRLAQFAIVIGVMVGVPPLAQRFRIPPILGLLFFGVLFGPHGLRVWGEHRPVVEFFGELGILLLMFSAGLETDVTLFRAVQNRTVFFGLVTTAVPLLLGTLFGLSFHYALLPAIVIGSLLGSHTLIALPIVNRLGVERREPVIVSVGATVLSDTLSLVVFAICLSTYTIGFSLNVLEIQIIEILLFVPLILFGLSAAGSYLMRRVQDSEEGQFLVLLGVMAVAGVLAQYINLPGIVGAFLAGLAVNGAAHKSKAMDKLDFFGRALFIPSFFVVTGFLIDPVVFGRTILYKPHLAFGLVFTLIAGKGIAALVSGRVFSYSRPATMTMWGLTLPQVAATLAATAVAYKAYNAAGQRMLNDEMLNAVLVMMLVTSVLGPLMTERFAPGMLDSSARGRGKGDTDRESATARRPTPEFT